MSAGNKFNHLKLSQIIVLTVFLINLNPKTCIFYYFRTFFASFLK